MSEGLLFSYIAQLRLLARAYTHCNSNGELVSGRINPVLEHLRLQVLDTLERVQDGLPLTEADDLAVQQAASAVDLHRAQIRQLRRELEAAA